MNREEMIAAIKTTTEELGRVPSLEELVAMGKINRGGIRRKFVSYRELLKACGLERKGPGYAVSMEALFRDWAGLVRRLGRVPTGAEFEVHGQHCRKPITRHFGGWSEVPAGMVKYAREHGMEGDWKDVLEVVAGHLRTEEEQAGKARWAPKPGLWPGLLKDEPVYGPPTVDAHLMLAPMNEQGVIFLFGAVARKLGFVMLRLQTEYPDGEALREMEPGKWQLIRIEFEYESRNFLLHGHRSDKCHVIVCWKHNWKECPVEVVELSKVISDQL